MQNGQPQLNRIKTLIFALLCIFSLCSQSAEASRHRYHTSLARVDYNAEEKQLEISIQLFTHDIQTVYEAVRRKNFDDDNRKETEDFLREYLKENFVLKNAEGKTIDFQWIGSESKVDLTFAYIQFPFEGDKSAADLRDTIFFESFAEQANLVICRFDENKFDLLYKVGDFSKKLKKEPVQ